MLPLGARLAMVALLYAASLTLAFLVGRVVGTDPLGVLFALGALALLASVLYVRGGSTTVYRLAARDSVWLHWLPRLEPDHSQQERRREELAIGMTIFSFAMALWATVLLVYRAVGPNPGMP